MKKTELAKTTLLEIKNYLDEALKFINSTKEKDVLAFSGSKNYIVSQLEMIKTLLDIQDIDSVRMEVKDTLSFISKHQKRDPLYLTGGAQIVKVVLNLINDKL